MKFLKVLWVMLLMAVAFQAHALIAPVNSSTSLDATGTLKAGSLEKVFIKVKNGSGGALLDGRVVVADTSADDGYTVTTSATASNVALCVIAQTSCASGAMCKCQVYGYHSAVKFDKTNANGAATAGFQGYLSENYAGYVEAKPLTSVDAYDQPFGVFLDSPSASGDTEMFLNLL